MNCSGMLKALCGTSSGMEELNTTGDADVEELATTTTAAAGGGDGGVAELKKELKLPLSDIKEEVQARAI